MLRVALAVLLVAMAGCSDREPDVAQGLSL